MAAIPHSYPAPAWGRKGDSDFRPNSLLQTDAEYARLSMTLGKRADLSIFKEAREQLEIKGS